MMRRKRASLPLFAELAVQHCYVGFLDILGFSEQVRTDFERARTAYQQILEHADVVPKGRGLEVRPAHVDITAASDSFMIVGSSLPHVANWCSGILVAAIRSSMLVRGSIAYGRHVQQNVHTEGTSRHHLLIVSEALSRAAEDEHRKTPPCGVTLEPSVPNDAIHDLDSQPETVWAKQRAILRRDGRWITNPFGGAELMWAGEKLQKMFDNHRGTSHEPKYRWLLDLFHDVKNNTAR